MPNIYDRFDDEPAAAPSQAGANPYDQFDEQPASFTRSAIDVAKQIPSGLVAGVESALTFPAQAAGFVGGLVEKIPGMAPSPEQAADRQKLLELTKGARQPFSRYLPEPETKAGQFARTGAEFVPAAVAGSTFAIPRAVGVGATTGLVSEGLGQAAGAVSPELEPYARVGGALVAGHMAGRLAEGAATKAAVKQLGEATEAAGAKGSTSSGPRGSLSIQAGPTYSQFLKSDLTSRGLTPRTADRTWAVLDDIERTPFTNPTQFQERYKELGSIAKKATDSEERLAANIAKERLLGFLENPPPWVVQGGDPVRGAQLLQEANANWAAAKRAENLDRRINKAELKAGSTYSGLNLENQLRQRIGVLAEPEVRGGFSPAEQRDFAKFAEGNWASNARRYAKNILGGGGGLGALVAGGAGVGAGQYFGSSPATGAGLATLAGLGLAKYGDMAALNRARQLQLMLLQRSPYATQAGAPGVRSGGALSTLAPTLGSIGQ
jgi:hypothetical protein